MLATISVDNGIQSVSANAIVDLNDLNEIGEFKYGGVIFWVNATNNDNGYVVSLDNQGSGTTWGCAGFDISGATGSAIGTGEANTLAIVSSCPVVGIAADVANDISNGFNDWFLPSLDELNEIFINRVIINTALTANGGTSFDNAFYWTSTQGSTNNAYYQFLGNQNVQSLNQKSNTAQVRAIKSF